MSTEITTDDSLKIARQLRESADIVINDSTTYNYDETNTEADNLRKWLGRPVKRNDKDNVSDSFNKINSSTDLSQEVVTSNEGFSAVEGLKTEGYEVVESLSSKSENLSRKSMNHAREIAKLQTNSLLGKMNATHKESLNTYMKVSKAKLGLATSTINEIKISNKFRYTIQAQYYRSSLMYKGQILSELQNINRTLKIGFNINDKNQKIADSQMEESLARLLFGPKWKEGIKKGFLKGMEKATGGALDQGMIEMIKSMAAGAIHNFNMKDQLKNVGRYAGKRISQVTLGKAKTSLIAKALGDPGQVFEDWATAASNGKNEVLSFLGEIYGRDKKKTPTIDVNESARKVDWNERSNFDRKAHHSLTTLIPNYLARIDFYLKNSIGKKQDTSKVLYFDWNQNKWQSSKGFQKEMEAQSDTIITDQLSKIDSKSKDFERMLSNSSRSDNPAIKYVKKLPLDQQREIINVIILVLKLHTKSGKMHGFDPATAQFLFTPDIILKVVGKNNKLLAQAVSEFVKALSNENWKDWEEVIDFSVDIDKKLKETAQAAIERYQESNASWEIDRFDSDDKNQIDKYKERRKKTSIKGLDSIDLDVDFEAARKKMDSLLSGKEMREYARHAAELANTPAGATFISEVISNTRLAINELDNMIKLESDGPLAKIYEVEKKVWTKFLEKMEAFQEKIKKGESAEIDEKDIERIIKEGKSFQSLNLGGADFKKLMNGEQDAKEFSRLFLESDKGSKIATGAVGGAIGISAGLLAKKMGGSPVASIMAGAAAAGAALLKGRIGEHLSILATEEGDEKMDNGKSKRRNLMENMIKDLLPAGLGTLAGINVSKFIKNNIRFGGILGPIMGFAVGGSIFAIAKSKKFLWLGKKIMGGIGKFASGIDKKLTGGVLTDAVTDIKNAVVNGLGIGKNPENKDILKGTSKNAEERRKKSKEKASSKDSEKDLKAEKENSELGASRGKIAGTLAGRCMPLAIAEVLKQAFGWNYQSNQFDGVALNWYLAHGNKLTIQFMQDTFAEMGIKTYYATGEQKQKFLSELQNEKSNKKSKLFIVGLYKIKENEGHAVLYYKKGREIMEFDPMTMKTKSVSGGANILAGYALLSVRIPIDAAKKSEVDRGRKSIVEDTSNKTLGKAEFKVVKDGKLSFLEGRKVKSKYDDVLKVMVMNEAITTELAGGYVDAVGSSGPNSTDVVKSTLKDKLRDTKNPTLKDRFKNIVRKFSSNSDIRKEGKEESELEAKELEYYNSQTGKKEVKKKEEPKKKWYEKLLGMIPLLGPLLLGLKNFIGGKGPLGVLFKGMKFLGAGVGSMFGFLGGGIKKLLGFGKKKPDGVKKDSWWKKLFKKKGEIDDAASITDDVAKEGVEEATEKAVAKGAGEVAEETAEGLAKKGAAEVAEAGIHNADDAAKALATNEKLQKSIVGKTLTGFKKRITKIPLIGGLLEKFGIKLGSVVDDLGKVLIKAFSKIPIIGPKFAAAAGTKSIPVIGAFIAVGTWLVDMVKAGVKAREVFTNNSGSRASGLQVLSVVIIQTLFAALEVVVGAFAGPVNLLIIPLRMFLEDWIIREFYKVCFSRFDKQTLKEQAEIAAEQDADLNNDGTVTEEEKASFEAYEQAKADVKKRNSEKTAERVIKAVELLKGKLANAGMIQGLIIKQAMDKAEVTEDQIIQFYKEKIQEYLGKFFEKEKSYKAAMNKFRSQAGGWTELGNQVMNGIKGVAGVGIGLVGLSMAPMYLSLNSLGKLFGFHIGAPVHRYHANVISTFIWNSLKTHPKYGFVFDALENTVSASWERELYDKFFKKLDAGYNDDYDGEEADEIQDVNGDGIIDAKDMKYISEAQKKVNALAKKLGDFMAKFQEAGNQYKAEIEKRKGQLWGFGNMVKSICRWCGGKQPGELVDFMNKTMTKVLQSAMKGDTDHPAFAHIGSKKNNGGEDKGARKGANGLKKASSIDPFGFFALVGVDEQEIMNTDKLNDMQKGAARLAWSYIIFIEQKYPDVGGILRLAFLEYLAYKLYEWMVSGGEDDMESEDDVRRENFSNGATPEERKDLSGKSGDKAKDAEKDGKREMSENQKRLTEAQQEEAKRMQKLFGSSAYGGMYDSKGNLIEQQAAGSGDTMSTGDNSYSSSEIAYGDTSTSTGGTTGSSKPNEAQMQRTTNDFIEQFYGTTTLTNAINSYNGDKTFFNKWNGEISKWLKEHITTAGGAGELHKFLNDLIASAGSIDGWNRINGTQQVRERVMRHYNKLHNVINPANLSSSAAAAQRLATFKAQSRPQPRATKATPSYVTGNTQSYGSSTYGSGSNGTSYGASQYLLARRGGKGSSMFGLGGKGGMSEGFLQRSTTAGGTGGAMPFYAQNTFLGQLNIGNETSTTAGCALAVAKMIISYKKIKINDMQLYAIAKRYILPDNSISTKFFTEIGGVAIDNPAELIRAKGSTMALIVKKNGYNHYVAAINNGGIINIGDPESSNWYQVQDPLMDQYFTTNLIQGFEFSNKTIPLLNTDADELGAQGSRLLGGRGQTPSTKGSSGGSVTRIGFGQGQQASKSPTTTPSKNGSGTKIMAGANYAGSMYEYKPGAPVANDNSSTSSGSNIMSEIPMPHGDVVRVFPKSKYPAQAAEAARKFGQGSIIVQYKDGTIAARGGIRALRNFNPGNQDKGNEWAVKKFGALEEPDGRQQVYPNPTAGLKSLYYQLFDKDFGVIYRDKSIRSAIMQYAPPKENNTESYIAGLVKAVGGGATDQTKLNTLNQQQKDAFVNQVMKTEYGGNFGPAYTKSMSQEIPISGGKGSGIFKKYNSLLGGKGTAALDKFVDFNKNGMGIDKSVIADSKYLKTMGFGGFSTTAKVSTSTGALLLTDDSLFKVYNSVTPPTNSKPYKAAEYALSKAQSKSTHKCANYVKNALDAGGYPKTNRCASAYQYHTNGALEAIGFTRISGHSTPQIGDVCVTMNGNGHEHGHISIYTKEGIWVSDFKQKSPNVYGDSQPGNAIYRDKDFLGTGGVNPDNTDGGNGSTTGAGKVGLKGGAIGGFFDSSGNHLDIEGSMARALDKLNGRTGSGTGSVSQTMGSNSWMAIAQNEKGVDEKGNSARVAEYVKSANGKVGDPWCGAFVTWCLKQSGLKIDGGMSSQFPTSSKQFKKLDKPQYGAIAVMLGRNTKDGANRGHITFFVSGDENDFIGLGGNQNNQVKESSGYPKGYKQLVGFYWPVDAEGSSSVGSGKPDNSQTFGSDGTTKGNGKIEKHNLNDGQLEFTAKDLKRMQSKEATKKALETINSFGTGTMNSENGAIYNNDKNNIFNTTKTFNGLSVDKVTSYGYRKNTDGQVQMVKLLAENNKAMQELLASHKDIKLLTEEQLKASKEIAKTNKEIAKKDPASNKTEINHVYSSVDKSKEDFKQLSATLSKWKKQKTDIKTESSTSKSK